jgi:hypothetical protein
MNAKPKGAEGVRSLRTPSFFGRDSRYPLHRAGNAHAQPGSVTILEVPVAE